jgi:hypothetical protein
MIWLLSFLRCQLIEQDVFDVVVLPIGNPQQAVSLLLCEPILDFIVLLGFRQLLVSSPAF